MQIYLDLLQTILERGKLKPTRTGIDTLSISGYMLEHDMSTGFPLLTTKRMGLKSISAELEFFIKGLHSKKWLQERNCHIWDDWCNPSIVAYGTDEETKKKMFNEDDLGRIYGVQWRNWATKIEGQTIDQFKNVVDVLKKDPLNRRLIVSAWRADEVNEMALPPCHYAWQVLSDGKTLDLIWVQRSCDTPYGIPYNIASYAMLLLLLAKESNLVAGKLIGQLADVHIYVNQIDAVKEQLTRTPKKLPAVTIENWKSIYDWKYTDFALWNYDSYGKLFMGDIAV